MSGKIGLILLLTALFVLWPRPASGFVRSEPEREDPSVQEARERLSQGFHQILTFFAERDFSLLEAWREMRASTDPEFFEHRYPVISRELDSWSSSLEQRFDVEGQAADALDFTFLVDEIGSLALGSKGSAVVRDNALATVCMVCVMDTLRCEAGAFHRFLAAVVAGDPSSARKAEALRWWRRSGGFIDEELLETVLSSAAAADLDLRSEAAKALFSIATRRSLRAQRLLASTSGLPEDPTGGQPRIACTAIQHIERAGFEEAVPDLLAALEDPSHQVRACAAESLARLSGQSFSFDPSSDGAGNAGAIAGWRAWWVGRAPGSASGTR